MPHVQDRFLRRIRGSREVPGVKEIIGQNARLKILGVVFKGRERKAGRGFLMEMLYRYGGIESASDWGDDGGEL